MDTPSSGFDDAAPPPAVTVSSPTPAERVLALFEILICSDYPTQIALAQTFAFFGIRPGRDSISLGYIASLTLLDTALLVGLMLFFLRARGESARHLFLGRHHLASELRAGLPLLFVAFGIAIALMLGLQAVAPQLHTVTQNPIQHAVKTPLDVVVLLLVLIVGGGIREEMQRAFLLVRFERWLGGARLGLVITSVTFGAGHLYEGADAAIVTAVLGAYWASIYLRRRSIGAPIVSHAGFNVVEVLQFLAFAR